MPAAHPRRHHQLLLALLGFASGTPLVSHAEVCEGGRCYAYFWSDGRGAAGFAHPSGGDRATFAWEESGAFLGGIGWDPGRAWTVQYTSLFEPEGNAYLQLFGETRSPRAEYSIIEAHGTFRPFPGGSPPSSGPRHLGNLTADGGTYQVWEDVRFGIGLGEETIHRYYSVREAQRRSGRISVGTHFAAYEALGGRLGRPGMQIMGVEGYFSSGRAVVELLGASGEVSDGAVAG